MLKIIDKIPFEANAWPGSWMWADITNSNSLELVQFAIRFEARNDEVLKLHVSADNQYKLYLDGEFVGTGPQKGDINTWYFDTYHFSGLESSEHVISALVYCNKFLAPTSQISVRAGFLAVAENEYGTVFNDAQNWKCRKLPGCKPLMVPEEAMHAGSGFDMAGMTVDEMAPSSELIEAIFGSVEPLPLGNPKDHRSQFDSYWGWRLMPRTVPALSCDYHSLGRVISSGQVGAIHSESTCSELPLCDTPSFPIRIAPHTKCRLLIDHGSLTKGFPVLIASGGNNSRISLTYQEGLQQHADDISAKGHRDNTAGCVAVGVTDIFRVDGRKEVCFEPLTCRCWRYVNCEIVTDDSPLEIHAIEYRSNGYPYEFKAEIKTDLWVERLVEPGFRTLRMCAEDTYLDCPYYERLQYIGDTRIQALLSYVLAGDDRLARQAIDSFDRSKLPNGMIQSRYPSRSRQTIPPFALLYVSLLHDFMMWRGDVEFLRKYLPGVKSILNLFITYQRQDGLLENVPGWNFVDWSAMPTWVEGMPPVGANDLNYILNFQYLYALDHARELFHGCGDDEYAGELALRSRNLREILKSCAFDARRNAFADDSGFKNFSQHANIMAILTNTHVGVIEGRDLLQKTLRDKTLASVSCYFSFYLFEAMYTVGRADLILPELSHWHDMLDNGLTTFSENYGKSRSDCHGWSVHPLYHFFASVLGIRPAEVGFARATIRPVLGSLKSVRADFMHPLGRIDVDFKQVDGMVSGVVNLPEGVGWSNVSHEHRFAVRNGEHDALYEKGIERDVLLSL